MDILSSCYQPNIILDQSKSRIILSSNINYTNIINRWGVRHALFLLTASGLTLIFQYFGIIILITSFSFLTLLFKSESKTILNWPNAITIFRFCGICISFILFSHTYWPFGLLLTVMVLLDILDGYLSRKMKSSSQLGFHLDMEVDAFFVLVMCLYYYLHRDIAFWILIPGLLRYLYIIYIHLFPKTNFVEKKQKYASLIAGTFFVLLLLGIVLPQHLLNYILLPGAMGIIVSFGISFIQHIQWKSQ